ncbi:MAG: murein biosynthesis integral membrane protein MurJ [Gemmatimonadaceae bacterium]
MSEPTHKRSRISAAGSRRPAAMVASGILLSRIMGLVRQKTFAFYFGVGPVADAFTAAFRIPNILQNLFGEGVLSASFIPVYSKLLARGDDRGRQEVAGAVLGVLAFLSSVVVLIGVLAAPILVDVIAVGFTGATRDLTVQLVRILFPGAGLLVLAAWCLGVLNSHRKFFLSYAAPVLWNAAMITTMLIWGSRVDLPRLAMYLAWGSVAGSAIQLLVQWRNVARIIGVWRVTMDTRSSHVRTVLKNFGPVFVGRGVTQLSAYIDSFIASLLIAGSVSTLNYAQLLYMLPVSLFGMSISAAELPAMSSVTGATAQVAEQLRERLALALQRIAFFIVPSAVAFLAFGDLVARLVYQGGEFGSEQAQWVWGVLAGSAVGLLASTLGRLYASVFYSLHDAKTPLRFAMVRVALTTGLGFAASLWLPGALGIDPRWGVAGLTSSAGVAAWIELLLLRRAVATRIGGVSIAPRALLILWACAGVAAAAGWGVRVGLEGAPGLWVSVLALAGFSLTYGLAALAAGVPQARAVATRVSRALGR